MGVATPISATFDAMLITDPPPEAIIAGMPNSISGNGETRSRLSAFSLFRPGSPEAVQTTGTVAVRGMIIPGIESRNQGGREHATQPDPDQNLACRPFAAAQRFVLTAFADIRMKKKG
jgi:hypothetical protein